MNIYGDYHITKAKHTEVIVTNIFGGIKKFDKEHYPSIYNDVLKIKRWHVSRKHTDEEVKELLEDILKKYATKPVEVKVDSTSTMDSDKIMTDEISEEMTYSEEYNEAVKNDNKETTLKKLINFFTEFNFEPNFRFCNTLSRNSSNVSLAKSYVSNYFRLTDNSYAISIIEKMKSSEFLDIIKELKEYNTKTKINNRFKLYYGSQGTGKTTKAMKEAKDCMVCHSAMLPSDLMEDFEFVDGKANFKPSALYNAMINGTIIVLDEINLLPFESLRFLQSILDGKKEFTYKGKTVEIKDGFKIIGTMNLQVNGMTYALPEPLVDRAEELEEFKLVAKDLVSAI